MDLSAKSQAHVVTQEKPLQDCSNMAKSAIPYLSWHKKHWSGDPCGEYLHGSNTQGYLGKDIYALANACVIRTTNLCCSKPVL